MATGFNTQTGNGEYRLQFETDNKELFLLMQETARRCVDGKPQTNADLVRAMSDEELAYWVMCPHDDLCDRALDGDCMKCTLQWLQQPAEDVAHGSSDS